MNENVATEAATTKKSAVNTSIKTNNSSKVENPSNSNMKTTILAEDDYEQSKVMRTAVVKTITTKSSSLQHDNNINDDKQAVKDLDKWFQSDNNDDDDDF